MLVRSTGASACLARKDVGLRRHRRVGVGRLCRGVSGRSDGQRSPLRRRLLRQRNQSGPRIAPSTPSGQSFLVGRTELGELRIGGYALVRWIDQLPGTTGVHRSPRERAPHRCPQRHPVSPGDGPFQRVALLAEVPIPDHILTVMSTDQTTLYGFLGYQFHKAFNLYGGTN